MSRAEVFQSAPPCGGRPYYVPHNPPHSAPFQSAPPCGGRRRGRSVDACSSIRFNPRPRAGGDPLAPPSVGAFGCCFNPRPRAGGDLPVIEHLVAKAVVSIRAPVRGATIHRLSVVASVLFQSAPPCGGRRGRWRRLRGCSGAGFNPRPRAGGDPAAAIDVYQAPAVSIRAPVRGATGSHRPRPQPATTVSIRAPVRGATQA